MNPRLRAGLPTVLDVVVPIAGYYLLSALGVDDFWALTIAGLATAVYTGVSTVRRGRLDGVGTLVVIEIVLSLVLLVVTRDPRIVLLKPSFFTGVAGLYLLWTCLAGRPLTAETSRPFATKGDPELERACDRAWDDSPAFRREHQRLTAVWGVLFAVESVVRAVVVLHVNVSTAVWAGAIPAIVAFVLAMAYTATRRNILVRHIESARETVPNTTAG